MMVGTANHLQSSSQSVITTMQVHGGTIEWDTSGWGISSRPVGADVVFCGEFAPLVRNWASWIIPLVGSVTWLIGWLYVYWFLCSFLRSE